MPNAKHVLLMNKPLILKQHANVRWVMSEYTLKHKGLTYVSRKVNTLSKVNTGSETTVTEINTCLIITGTKIVFGPRLARDRIG